MREKLFCLILALISMGSVKGQSTTKVPSYLSNYASVYSQDPKKAASKWYQDARYGLFIHWGASTQYEKGDWVMFYNKIPMEDYQNKVMDFVGDKFNAQEIVNMVKDAGMKYITFVVKHHDGFALFDTKANKFSSIHARSNRDYLKELAEACEREAIGLFVYYSIGIDWNYPFYLTKEYYKEARPAYDVQPEQIRFKSKEDFQYYWNFVKVQIYELATQYGSLAGFWFDPIGGAYTNPDLFDIQSIYDMISRLQPQALVSYKTGFNGNEDFISCEHEIKSLAPLLRKVQSEVTADMAETAWNQNKFKPAEMCTTMQKSSWEHRKGGEHISADQVWTYLSYVADRNANLLLNIGPRADGSIVPIDKQVLLEVGERIKNNGLPKMNTETYKQLRDKEQTEITKRDLETQK